MTVLYRAHYLTRTVEEVLQREKIPYTIYSGVQFFGRAEIKDALSYLRMIACQDDLSFLRIVNQPKRNIGERRRRLLQEQAAQEAAAKEADAALEALTGESADTTDRADTEDAQKEDGTESDTQQADSTEGQVLQAVESDTGNENATKFKAAVTDVPRVIGITRRYDSGDCRWYL